MRSNSTESESQDTSPLSSTQAEGATKRRDVAKRSNVSAAVRQPQTKQDARTAPKGASEKRRDVIVDSDQPSRKKQHDTEISSDARTGSGTSLGHQDQKAETTKAVRKSSKISLGGRSTASGRHQASALNASRNEGRVSRTASKASLRGPDKPPHVPLGPAASHSTVALTQAALVSALPHPAKTSKPDKDLSRSRPAIQFLGHPKGKITSKSSKAQLAQPTASCIEQPARRQKSFTGAATAAPPDASRTSRASRNSLKRSVSEKAPAPTNRDSRASLVSASRRSVASAASRRSRSSTGAREGSGGSKSSHRHRRSERDFRNAELEGERDHSLASVVSLAGDSRASVASSKGSLRPIGKEEEIRPKRKVLQMPDGTYVGLSQKNSWLRAMHEKYLGWDYMSCTMKAAFGMMLLGFIYILMFRQDLLLQVAIFGSYSTVPGARIAPPATEVARQYIRGSHSRFPKDRRHR